MRFIVSKIIFETMEIPVVDFSAFLNGNQDEKICVSNELINVVKNYGFVYLKNINIPKDEIEKAFEMSKTFFSKSLEYKMSVKKSHETFCGYDALLVEKLTSDKPGDLKESYMIKKNGTPWPSDWDEFKQAMYLFHSQCYSLVMEILRSFAIGLNLNSNYFDDKFHNGDVTLLRLLHYPPLPDEIEHGQIRAGEHTDYGALTLLFQDEVGGLEVKTLDNKWIPAPYIPNTILINVGDVMQMWTNGFLNSTPHRVVNPVNERKSTSRYSIAFFTDPDLDCLIKPIDNFVSEDNPSKYPVKLFRDHLFYKYKTTYSTMHQEQ